MKLLTPIFLACVLAVVCAVPAVAHVAGPAQQYQNDQDRDRDRNTQAYADGFAQGQSDARSQAARNDQPTARWTKDDDQRAFRQGYDAGFQNGLGNATNAAPVPPSARMASGDQQAEQFGYQDGLAAGRHDRNKGDKFKPQDHDMYKHATHGWSAELGTKDQFKQLYRQNFLRGYDDGYGATGPK